MAITEHQALDAQERARLRAVIDLVPDGYVVHLDESSWKIEGESLALYRRFREAVLAGAIKNDLDPAGLGALLLEMSAALWANGMTRQTFVRNAELWYDSCRLAAPEAVHNAPGTKGEAS